MPEMKNLAILGLAAAILLPGWSLAQPTSGDAQNPRIEIALFKYHGSETKFDVFHGLFKQKILNLRTKILRTWGSSYDNVDYIADIHVKYHADDTFGSPGKVFEWMRSQGVVLNVMRGTILSDDGTNYVVFSQFYLPNWSTNLRSNVITVSLPIRVDEFSNTQDSHTLVILYALAVDARRLGLAPAFVAQFLSKAKNLFADIERRSGTLSNDLAALKGAVESAERELLGKK